MKKEGKKYVVPPCGKCGKEVKSVRNSYDEGVWIWSCDECYFKKNK